jgi:lipopolysaccharide export system permease protein
MLSAGKAYGESGQISPALGLWAPNVIFAAVAVYFLKRAANERPFTFRSLPEFVRRRLIEN